MPKGFHKNHRKGPSHPRWNSGKIISTDGYVKVRVGVDHPLADGNGYAYEHLVVWVSSGNPKPNTDEVIHHINGNKQDNRFANLELKTRYEHSTSHATTISDEDVRAIREAYASGEFDMKKLSDMYGTSTARISKYIRGESRLKAGGPISTNNRGKKAAGRMLDGREWDEVPE